MEPKKSRAISRQRRENTNRTRHGLILAAIFAAVIVLFDLLTLLIPDRKYSASENRMLAQAPVLSGSALADGSFFEKAEDHLADQFVLRDLWMSLDLFRARIFGAKENGGVYLCRDRYLMQVPSEPNTEAVERNLAAINRFAAKYKNLDCYLCTVPNAFCILEKKLPIGAPVRDQKADIAAIAGALQGVKFLDVTEALEAHSGEYLYYRTDHHWTSLGAKYAFEAMAPELGIEPTQDYDVYTVSTKFQGTLSSKSGSHGAKDTITIYTPTYGVEYKVTYRDTQTTTCSVYDSSCLQEKDQYTVFLGGNHPRVDIATTSANKHCLLIFKDSYANCFVQFLTPCYQKIILIDPRYYYDKLETLIRQEGVTDVLFLYNTDTFLTDNALADVLEGE